MGLVMDVLHTQHRADALLVQGGRVVGARVTNLALDEEMEIHAGAVVMATGGFARDAARLAIEQALLASHRHVFGVFFWFVLFSTLGLGPLGAVLYRMAEFAARYWTYPSKALGVPANQRLMAVSQQMFSLIDHVPARLTAFGFAVVGNFEEAINAWRRDASLWKHSNEGVILASAAGAVGVQLGGSAAPGVTPDRSRSFEAGPTGDAAAEGSTGGDPPQTGHLRSVVGLVWRSVVLWMLLVALLTLANLLG